MTTQRVRANRGDWFLGESQLDPGEWGFDGTIWCPPTAQDMEAEKADPTRYAAEPYLIAEHVSKPDAERIVVCVNAHDALLAACERLIQCHDAALVAAAQGTFKGEAKPCQCGACVEGREAIANARKMVTS